MKSSLIKPDGWYNVVTPYEGPRGAAKVIATNAHPNHWPDALGQKSKSNTVVVRFPQDKGRKRFVRPQDVISETRPDLEEMRAIDPLRCQGGPPASSNRQADLPLSRNDLFHSVDADRLAGIYDRLLGVVETQADKAEQYPSTQYTASASDGMNQTALAMSVIGTELRAWHEFLHPNKTVIGPRK